MRLSMGQNELEHPELFALEFGKIAESDFVYTPASTNIDQSAPNLVKMYVTIRLRMSSIMDLIGPELSELSALEFENFPYVTYDHSFKHGCFPIYIQYLTTTLGRIFFSSVVMVLAYQPGGPGSNPARIIYFCHTFIHFFLCYGLCS